MSGSVSGCCCGIIIGGTAALLAVIAGIVALYLWWNPDVREEAETSATRIWVKVSSDVDEALPPGSGGNPPEPRVAEPVAPVSK